MSSIRTLSSLSASQLFTLLIATFDHHSDGYHQNVLPRDLINITVSYARRVQRMIVGGGDAFNAFITISINHLSINAPCTDNNAANQVGQGWCTKG
jgi:uncharacterized MAPEG superfamily protein